VATRKMPGMDGGAARKAAEAFQPATLPGAQKGLGVGEQQGR